MLTLCGSSVQSLVTRWRTVPSRLAASSIVPSWPKVPISTVLISHSSAPLRCVVLTGRSHHSALEERVWRNAPSATSQPDGPREDGRMVHHRRAPPQTEAGGVVPKPGCQESGSGR